jgi:hypothetical protein
MSIDNSPLTITILPKVKRLDGSYTEYSIKQNLNPVPALIQEIVYQVLLTFKSMNISAKSKLLM